MAAFRWAAVLNVARDGVRTDTLVTPPNNPMLLELAERLAANGANV